MSAVYFFVILLWSLAYLMFRDSIGNGQSWGKKICGLMVVRLVDNRPCNAGNSFIRNLVSIISFLIVYFGSLMLGPYYFNPVILCALYLSILVLYISINSRGQHPGDMMAKTQVIEIKDYRPGKSV